MCEFLPERVFIGSGPDLPYPAAVFATNQLSEDECRMLVASVQKSLTRILGADWKFELVPAFHEDAVTFVHWKSDWITTTEILDWPDGFPPDTPQRAIEYLHNIAATHDKVIRELRETANGNRHAEDEGCRQDETVAITDVPSSHSPFTNGDEVDQHVDTREPEVSLDQIRSGRQPLELSEDLKSTYSDPDNYERNIWLHNQKLAGKTDKEILLELKSRATEFALLDTSSGLRAAIKSISLHHGVPVPKGKPGRPSRKLGSSQPVG
jgi:hypothetical protein